jgi:hypothetical protein
MARYISWSVSNFQLMSQLLEDCFIAGPRFRQVFMFENLKFVAIKLEIVNLNLVQKEENIPG